MMAKQQGALSRILKNDLGTGAANSRKSNARNASAKAEKAAGGRARGGHTGSTKGSDDEAVETNKKLRTQIRRARSDPARQRKLAQELKGNARTQADEKFADEYLK